MRSHSNSSIYSFFSFYNPFLQSYFFLPFLSFFFHFQYSQFLPLPIRISLFVLISAYAYLPFGVVFSSTVSPQLRRRLVLPIGQKKRLKRIYMPNQAGSFTFFACPLQTSRAITPLSAELLARIRQLNSCLHYTPVLALFHITLLLKLATCIMQTEQRTEAT